MGCRKDLAEGEELLVIKKIGKVRTNISIAKRTDRCVMTDIGDNEDFGKNPSKGNLNLIAVV